MIDNIAGIISVLSIHTAGGTTVDPRRRLWRQLFARHQALPSLS